MKRIIRKKTIWLGLGLAVLIILLEIAVPILRSGYWAVFGMDAQNKNLYAERLQDRTIINLGDSIFGNNNSDTGVKYSLQGTTQGRYLTGGVPPVRFSM